MSQKFTVQFTVTTECTELVNANDVRRWAEEKFEGCDLGSVSVDAVSEARKSRTAKSRTDRKRKQGS